MKKKQYIDFSFQVIQSQPSIRDKQNSSQKSIQIKPSPQQFMPVPVNYRHLNMTKTQQTHQPHKIFDIQINDKINRISDQLQENIKKRIQLQKKLDQVKNIQTKKDQRKVFMAYSGNSYKNQQESTQLFQKMNQKSDKINQFTQKYAQNHQQKEQTHANSLLKNKNILLQYDQPLQTFQKQKILIPILHTFSANKKVRSLSTVPNQIKIQQYLRKVTFPELPKQNLQKLNKQIQELFAVHSPHSDIHYLCMVINFHLKKYSKVRKFFEQIVNFKIFNEKSYWIAAQSEFIMQNYDICLKLTEECMNRLDSKLLPRFIYLKAKSYENIGNYINSIICFNQLIKIRPKISEYYLERGILYHRVGYYKESKQDFVTFGILKPQAQQFIKEKILEQKNEVRKRQLISLLARMF